MPAKPPETRPSILERLETEWDRSAELLGTEGTPSQRVTILRYRLTILGMISDEHENEAEDAKRHEAAWAAKEGTPANAAVADTIRKRRRNRIAEMDPD